MTITVQAPETIGADAVSVSPFCPSVFQFRCRESRFSPHTKAAGICVAALSADPAAKAQSWVAENGWRFPVAYGLTIEQMRALGLYISEPRSPRD